MKNFSESPNPKGSEIKPDQRPLKSEIEPHELTSRMSKEQIGQFVDLLLKTGKPGEPNESMVSRSQQPNKAKSRPLAARRMSGKEGRSSMLSR